MKISFLTSGHYPLDDRIFHHMAKSLAGKGHTVQIVSSKEDRNETSEGISVNSFDGALSGKREKIKEFSFRLHLFKPSVIICSEPLTILAARRCTNESVQSVKIFYDITEWYPSRRNLAVHKKIFRWFVFIKLLFFNFAASAKTDYFIFGEWYKSRPYRLLFPWKKFIYTTYYPDLKYIRYTVPELKEGTIRLFYAGKICRDKGYLNFLNVVNRISQMKKELRIEVMITGWYEDQGDYEEFNEILGSSFNNITISVTGKQDFLHFTGTAGNTDIFLDLRSSGFENNFSLPIKLFYYAAAGRPVIFSDLKAIRKEIDISGFGYSVNPENYDEIAAFILSYTENRDLYYRHCQAARDIALQKCNWHKIEPDFIRFITSL